MLIYATETDYVNHTQEYGPDNLAALLRAASRLVAHATRTAVYAVDGDGYPADPTVRQAFRDAVLEQVDTWVTLGVNPTAGVAGTNVVASSSIGKASITYAASSTAVDATAATLTALTPDAAWCLESAGITGTVAAW